MSPQRIFLSLGVMAVSLFLVVPSSEVSAQQTSTFMFDADTYWSGYWDWYDGEYVRGYRARAPMAVPGAGDDEAVVGGGYRGQSPAISGAPDAGGDYDDYPAEFYVPGGATKFYDKPGRPPAADRAPGDVLPTRPGTEGAARPVLEPAPGTAPEGVRTLTPRDTDSIPPDIDAPLPPRRAPAADAKPEIWY